MSITRIDPPLSVLTPLGDAEAHFLWCLGPNEYLYFVCFQLETGECWTFDNRHVRLAPVITACRPTTSPIAPLPGLEPHLARHTRPETSANAA